MKVTNDDYSDYDDGSYDGVIEDPIYNHELDEYRDKELDKPIWDVYEDDETLVIRSFIYIEIIVLTIKLFFIGIKIMNKKLQLSMMNRLTCWTE